MTRLLRIAVVALLCLAAVIGTGCTSNPRKVADTILSKFTGVCGFTIRINVSVRVDQGQIYQVVEGNTHLWYRDYTVTCKCNPSRSPTIHTIADRSINDPRIGEYELYNDRVAFFHGTPWNQIIKAGQDSSYSQPAQSSYTINQTGTGEGADVYEEVKPSGYITVMGMTWDFAGTIDHDVEQVSTFLKCKFTAATDGTAFEDIELKIPFQGQLPTFTDTKAYHETWYEIEIYVPIGGKLYQQIPDEFLFTGYTTVDHYKAGYTQNFWSLSGPSLPSLDAFLLGTGVTGVTVFVLCYEYFDWHWDDETYFAYGTSPRPHGLERTDGGTPLPTESRWWDIVINLY
jgi:hypothetical protein